MSDSSSRSLESTPGVSVSASKRVARPNPVVKSSEERAKVRRKAFLERVSGARDDQRWDGRSDQAWLNVIDGLRPYANFHNQILRSDYIAEQRRWEKQQQRSAPAFPEEDELEDEENELPIPSQDMMKTDFGERDSFQMHTMSDEVEAIAHQEEQELEELVALVGEETKEPGSERWGSDEEDYDNLFMEYLSSQQHPRQQTVAEEGEEEEAMDTSIG